MVTFLPVSSLADAGSSRITQMGDYFFDQSDQVPHSQPTRRRKAPKRDKRRPKARSVLTGRARKALRADKPAKQAAAMRSVPGERLSLADGQATAYRVRP